MTTYRLFPLILFLAFFSCTDIPDLDKIDLQKWKEDKDACSEYRIGAVQDLLSQQEKLRGLSQNQMIKLLGAADKHQLYERSQKFFIYFLEPNENCSQYSGDYIKALYIRFNSLDQAVDFNIQKVK